MRKLIIATLLVASAFGAASAQNNEIPKDRKSVV